MTLLGTVPNLVNEIINVAKAAGVGISGSASSIIDSLRGIPFDDFDGAAMSAFLTNASAELILCICVDKGIELSQAMESVRRVAALAASLEIKRRDTIEIELLYELIPRDFPCPVSSYSLSGAHTKLALVEYAGEFYEPGLSPPEIVRRWDTLEDLAQQFATRALETEHGKYANLTQQEILSQYLARLLTQTEWGSPDELTWVIVRTASILRWQFVAGVT